MKPASTCWSCTARTAISCTSSCRRNPISAVTNMAARKSTGCASSPRSRKRCARIGRMTSRFRPAVGGRQCGWGPEQSARLASILKTKGVDVIDCSSGGITDVAPILGKEIKYSYQVPLSDYVSRHAEIMTMAVGLIIHGDQAEQILRDGQADLIAVGREILNNPNWPMDAALKLGVEGPFRTCRRSSAIGLAPAPSAVLGRSRHVADRARWRHRHCEPRDGAAPPDDSSAKQSS